MISAIAGASAICCFAVSYVAHQVLPVKPISEASMVSSQSTTGTINLLSKEELQRQAKTPKEFVDFYLKKQATLENVAEAITKTTDIREAHRVIIEKSIGDDTGYFELLKKSLEDQYIFLKPNESPQVSISITRGAIPPGSVQSQVVPSL
jgi:predicted RNA binding protein with dsRBD fold (UPF0201 family)